MLEDFKKKLMSIKSILSKNNDIESTKVRFLTKKRIRKVSEIIKKKLYITLDKFQHNKLKNLLCDLYVL